MNWQEFQEIKKGFENRIPNKMFGHLIPDKETVLLTDTLLKQGYELRGVAARHGDEMHKDFEKKMGHILHIQGNGTLGDESKIINMYFHK